MNDKKPLYSFVRNKVAILDADTSYSRAMCAKLRGAIGKHPGNTPGIWDITLQGFPDKWRSQKGEPSHAEWAAHTALTLYAMHRQGKGRTMNKEGISLGMAIRMLVPQDTDDSFEAVRRRFNAVATAVEFTELAHHARGLIQLIKAADIPLDYPQFAEDLLQFKFDADRVRLRWGEDFYRIKKEDDTNERGNIS
jgi:CRISPR system Cascade subunit CasB